MSPPRGTDRFVVVVEWTDRWGTWRRLVPTLFTSAHVEKL